MMCGNWHAWIFVKMSMVNIIGHNENNISRQHFSLISQFFSRRHLALIRHDASRSIFRLYNQIDTDNIELWLDWGSYIYWKNVKHDGDNDKNTTSISNYEKVIFVNNFSFSSALLSHNTIRLGKRRFQFIFAF